MIHLAKRKREEDQERTEQSNNNINKYFNSKPVGAVSKPKVCLVTK